MRLSPIVQDELFLAAPKVTQAVIAALGDYYTWKLGERVYGRGSNEAWAAVCSTHSIQWNTISTSISQCNADASIFSSVAFLDRHQSLAMVLFHTHALQLLGNNFDHRCTISMAVALVFRGLR